jgi:serine/threonine protein kinase
METTQTTTLLADRFEIGPLIGGGGMGDVFEGVDHREARRVAIKRLRPYVARDAQILQRFSREGAVLRAASHPNIVGVLAVVDDPAGPCIVMEHVPGGTLEDLLHREPRLPIERVLALALDLSDALARAHRLGIVHRDLKPSNVLLAEDGTPRLSDFGIAAVADGTALTGTGMVLGTLPYVSPEGWDGAPPDARADIWALGVMLYEMLAGRRPFLGAHAGLLHAAIVTSEPPRLDTLRPDAPAALVDAIATMLAKDPARRMASVRELGVIVERLRRGDEVTPPTASRRRAAARSLFRRRRSSAAARNVTRSARCSSIRRCACSRSPAPAAAARHASRSRRRGACATASRTASRSWTSRRSPTRTACSPRSPTRSRSRRTSTGRSRSSSPSGCATSGGCSCSTTSSRWSAPRRCSRRCSPRRRA